MKASLFAITRRSGSEFLLALLAITTAALLASQRATSELLAVSLLAILMLGRALGLMHRAGTLRLAWSCPHVDALRLPLPHDGLTWRACDAGERVLAALDGTARGYRDFFPTARRDVRTAVARALEPGTPVEELESIIRSLREIGDRLQAVQFARAGQDPREALESLATRSHALASAVEELAPRSNVVPLRNGVRS